MRTLLSKRSILSILAVAACAAAAAGMMRTGFTWTGVAAGGGNAAFNAHCNWHSGPFCLDPPIYADDTCDTATFPWKTTGAWDCGLITEEIGNLTIEGNVDFDTDGGTVTLNAAKLIISPTTGDIEITMTGTAKIVVD